MKRQGYLSKDDETKKTSSSLTSSSPTTVAATTVPSRSQNSSSQRCSHQQKSTDETRIHQDTSSDFAIALALQNMEQEKRDRQLKQEYKQSLKARKPDKHEHSDKLLAQFLQVEEERPYHQADYEEEKRAMAQSCSGRAVMAVQLIMQAIQTVKSQYPSLANYIDAVAIDDMVFLAERLLIQQLDFRNRDIPWGIDIGFHYTNPRNMKAIRTNGLLTKAERQSQNIQTVNSNGSVFGDGVYTANNPTSFQNFGEMGLLVGRLQGKAVRVPGSLKRASKSANTIIGNKKATDTQTNWPAIHSFNEVVLKSSSQCLPMVKYDTEVMRQTQGEQCILIFKSILQGIVDEIFNQELDQSSVGKSGTATPSSELASIGLALSNPSYNTSGGAGASAFGRNEVTSTRATTNLGHATPSSFGNTFGTTANSNSTGGGFGAVASPICRHNSNSMATTNPNSATQSVFVNTISPITNNVVRSCHLIYNAPNCLMSGVPTTALISPPSSCEWNDDCAICQDTLSTQHCAALNVCNHVFHRKCIERALQSKVLCPICRKAVAAPQGQSPSGSMNVSTSSSRCSGFQEDSIIIVYKIKEGTQKKYHINPGQHHPGKCAKAYLPNNSDGRDLLKRLKYAFRRGLTFTVGTSATTGKANQCTWSGIHHKTSRSGGVRSHGFPDTSYITNCNRELDAAGVPPSLSLNSDGREI